MRELRFRAWIEKENYMMSHREMMNYFEDMRGLDSNYDIFNDRDLIIQISTGFHDVNGIEIYEGDILYNPHDRDGYHEVIWSDYNGAWCLGDEESYPIRRYSLDNYWEVVGNIHENKELLEEK